MVAAGVDVVIKWMIFHCNSSKIVHILKDLQSFYDLETYKSNILKNPNNANKSYFYLLKNARIVDIYIKYILISGLMYLIAPALSSIFIYINDSLWMDYFPTELWLPFDTTNYFIPIYIYQFFSILNFMLCIISSESMILMIIVHINYHLQKIHDELIGNKKYDQNFKFLVERHCKISE